MSFIDFKNRGQNAPPPLKHVFMDGKKVRRMDVPIHTLMKLIYHMQKERVIRKTMGNVSERNDDIKERHKRATASSFTIAQIDDNSWTVLSQSNEDTNL